LKSKFYSEKDRDLKVEIIRKTPIRMINTLHIFWIPKAMNNTWICYRPLSEFLYLTAIQLGRFCGNKPVWRGVT
jgi:hypothetical protein